MVSIFQTLFVVIVKISRYYQSATLYYIIMSLIHILYPLLVVEIIGILDNQFKGRQNDVGHTMSDGK